MGITIAQGSPQTIWVPEVAGGTLYGGGIVETGQGALDEGVKVFADDAGIAGNTNHGVPYGVIIGSNRKVKVWDTTELCEIITAPAAADAHDGASIEYYGVEGPWGKGDPVPMVKVAIITPSAVLRAPLKATDAATAPALLTATNTSSDGLGITTNANDYTLGAVALHTIYCRSGANAGAYRIVTSTSATVHTWDNAMIADIAIGDTFVMVPMRPYGHSTIRLDHTTASWIDCDDAPIATGTARLAISILRLDLREAGKEFVEFMFAVDHFGAYVSRA